MKKLLIGLTFVILSYSSVAVTMPFATNLVEKFDTDLLYNSIVETTHEDEQHYGSKNLSFNIYDGNLTQSSQSTIWIDPETGEARTDKWSNAEGEKIEEITQIGFSKPSWSNKIMAHTMPPNVKVLPTYLPKEIESTDSMFSNFKGIKIEGISEWDTSNVIDMSSMFWSAKNFNDDISKWDTSNVTNMRNMFLKSENFNIDISNWDTSNVTDMYQMFAGSEGMGAIETNFNQPIGSWNVSNVVNMENMFFKNKAFNQDISNWNTWNVENMNYMFSGAKKFEQDLSSWNVENTTSFKDFSKHSKIQHNQMPLFEHNQTTKYIDNLTSKEIEIYSSAPWGVKEITQIGYYKNEGEVIPYQMPSSVEKVPDKLPEELTSLYGMFDGLSSKIIQGIEKWDTSNITNMKFIFFRSSGFNKDISMWNTSNVTNMNYMFNEAKSFNQDLSMWDFKNVNDYVDFSKDSVLTENHIPRWQEKETIIVETKYIDSQSGKEKESSNGIIPNGVTEITELGYTKETNELTRSHRMPSLVKKVPSQLPKEIEDITTMFFSSKATKIEGIESWDTSNVRKMSETFARATSFNHDISNWDVSNVTDMSHMFSAAINFDQNISKWNTGKVIKMNSMFSDAMTFNQNISKWDTNNVVYMDYMFNNTYSFNQDISSWDTRKVQSMRSVFQNTRKFDQNISGWDVSNVINMDYMFYNAYSFGKNNSIDLSKWDISKVRKYRYFAIGSNLDKNKYPNFKTHN